jgi:hypothetical protein
MTARVALVARGLSWRALALGALASLLLAFALSTGLRTLVSASSGSAAAGAADSSRGGLASLSPAARAAISATLGAKGTAYHFQASADGFRAANPIQDLGIRASQAGVMLRARGLALGLRLQALGYGRALHALAAVTPSGAGNRVTYTHAGIGEWYVNGPLGLEQGFTINRAPADIGAGPLTLAIAVSGNARASLAAGGQSVTFTGARGGLLRYGGLSVSDAHGHALRSWLELDGGKLLLRVDARDASFPLRVDPMVEGPEAKLSPHGKEGEDAGLSVALSADGNTALVGAPNGEVAGGIVWVFSRSGSQWQKSGELTLPAAEGEAGECAEGSEDEPLEEGNECGFGSSLALSANGDTAVIGAPRQAVEVPARHPEVPGETEEVSQAGAVWVFTRSEAGWTETAELANPEAAAKDHFGRSVALAGDGETALVGAPGQHGGQGRAWVFTGSGSSWAVQGGALSGAGEQGEGHFGRSVALSGSGSVALVGAPGDDSYLGAAWVFEYTGSTWQERGPKLTGAGEGSDGHFGCSVALSEDGSTAIVGARDDEGKGAAWVFARSVWTWVEQGPKLVGGGEEGEEFGYSVALSVSGDSAIVGAPHAATTPAGASRPISGRGSAWLFERSGTSWSEARQFEGGVTETGRARFGTSVAMSPDDGETVLIGGPNESGKGGAAWVFGPGPSIESVSPNSGELVGGTKVTIKGGHLGSATAVRFGSSEAASFKAISEGEIEAVSPAGTGTVDVTVTTPFGVSAATTADQFTYVPPAKKKGKEPEEHQGSGGGNGNGGTGPGNGNEQPPSNAPNAETPVSSGTGAAQAVLAFGPTASVCGARLLSKHIAVQRHNRALFKLVGTGAGKCAGKLRLRVKLKLAHGRFKLKTIGTAVFSIASGKRVSVIVKLNKTGRSLLSAGHGGLNASLLLVKQSPTPFVSHTASVHLARQRPKPKPKT